MYKIINLVLNYYQTEEVRYTFIALSKLLFYKFNFNESNFIIINLLYYVFGSLKPISTHNNCPTSLLSFNFISLFVSSAFTIQKESIGIVI